MHICLFGVKLNQLWKCLYLDKGCLSTGFLLVYTLDDVFGSTGVFARIPCCWWFPVLLVVDWVT